MQKRKKFDPSSADAGKLRDEIVHGTFMTEGTMIAFPLCFPGASVPIRADESRITALDVASSSGMVYGGTSGRQTHLFVGMFHGVTGAVLDMGTVEDADQCVAMCCGQSKFVACVNGPTGGRFVRRGFQGLPFDLIQEWSFRLQPFEDLGTPVPGERFVHALTDSARQKVIAATEGHLVSMEIDDGTFEVVGGIPECGQLAVGSNGSVFGQDTENTLWHYRPYGGLTRQAFDLPQGPWTQSLIWAKDPNSGKLYTSDDEGQLFSFTEEQGFSACLGKTPLTPVSTMAVTLDGRLFGSCGEGIGRLFSYTPGAAEITDIGVAVSVFERRRYGYSFRDAVVGRDGQIFFGEDDDLGHLWIYFPRIPGRAGKLGDLRKKPCSH